ncbi:MAG: hypothetical protein J6Y08_08865 [Clostridiales bacterium]|nr:hypothetical protein [Clostridiales bacterium]
MNMREALDAIVASCDLINRTFDNFWVCYDDYLTDEITKEEAEEFGLLDRNSVEARLNGYAFCVTDKYGCDLLKVYLDVYKKKQTSQFARYVCIYTTDGQIIDDIFSI